MATRSGDLSTGQLAGREADERIGDPDGGAEPDPGAVGREREALVPHPRRRQQRYHRGRPARCYIVCFCALDINRCVLFDKIAVIKLEIKSQRNFVRRLIEAGSARIYLHSA